MKITSPPFPGSRRRLGTRRLIVLAILLALPHQAAAVESREVLYVVYQGVDLVDVLDPQTLDVEASIPLAGGGAYFAGTPDGRRVYAPDPRGMAVIDTATNQIVATVDLGFQNPSRGGGATAGLGGASSPGLVGVSPDSAFIYIPTSMGSSDGVILIVSTATNSVVATVETLPFPRASAVTPDGTEVWLTLEAEARVQRVSTASNTVVGEIALTAPPGSLTNIAFSPDGSLAYVCTQAGLAVVDLTTFAQVTEIPIASGCQWTAVRPDGARLYVDWVVDPLIVVIDAEQNTVVDEIPVARHPRMLATSFDGSRLFVISTETDFLTVIDTATNEVLMAKKLANSEPAKLLVVRVPPPLPTPTATPSPTPTEPTAPSSGGCALDPRASAWPCAAALVALSLLVWRRFGQRG